MYNFSGQVLKFETGSINSLSYHANNEYQAMLLGMALELLVNLHQAQSVYILN